jgi:hypothetical protein
MNNQANETLPVVEAYLNSSLGSPPLREIKRSVLEPREMQEKASTACGRELNGLSPIFVMKDFIFQPLSAAGLVSKTAINVAIKVCFMHFALKRGTQRTWWGFIKAFLVPATATTSLRWLRRSAATQQFLPKLQPAFADLGPRPGS